MVAFTLSILLHELAHALMALRFGIGVSEINLGFFAAGTHIEGERKTPFEEFAVSVVGPIASLLVGGLAYLGSRAVDEGVAYVALWQLAVANLIVGVTNLLPGLPLDGGWVLRAFVWKVTGNMHTGTIVGGLGRPDHRDRRCWRHPCILRGDLGPRADADRLPDRAGGRVLPVDGLDRAPDAGAAAAEAARAPGPHAGPARDRGPFRYADLRGRPARRRQRRPVPSW